VDQVGRKSETTLGITSLHVETGAFAAATPDEFEPPAGAPDTRNRQRRRRQRTDAPARDGRCGLAEIGGVLFLCVPLHGSAPPSCVVGSRAAADGDADSARTFRGKLKTAGGRHGKPRHFGDHRAKPA
jgi:hypothetical protein